VKPSRNNPDEQEKRRKKTMKADVIIVGGGHAGVEAAFIASQKNLSVLLITAHIDLIAQMSCNPAIGGIAKGNIVREIDALGGLMGRAIDYAGIHFKMLNRSKGMAVWGPRAQADKKKYRAFVRKELESRNNISLLQAKVETLVTRGEKISAVILDNGETIEAGAVILAMGTFLNGVGHIGLASFPCGRSGEAPSLRLTESIEALGIQSGRMKTGTSPRIDARSVDFSKTTEQKGDEAPWPFSFSNVNGVANAVSCWATRTTDITHDIIRQNLDRSPLYTGKIKSIGPRYCPSIEDKVVRFGDRGGHTLFLEPEDLETAEMYLNGLSTSLPFDVQLRMVFSVPGLEHARIIRPGYGIEYDYFQPLQLFPTLESKAIKNLYFAGQINGTSGYEEAACQGIIAGMNAALSLCKEEPVILERQTSYTGVLIDDLVTKGTEEPYRMFTSRAEYRLLLRQDNADERLLPIAFKNGFVKQEAFECRRKSWEQKQKIREDLARRRINPDTVVVRIPGRTLQQACPADDFLRRPEVSILDIEEMTGAVDGSLQEKLSIEADIKYAGFVEKQQREIELAGRMEQAAIPAQFDYAAVPGLLNEARQKFTKTKPANLGQASRIPGVTPADISILMANLKTAKPKI
jgi:tRNA uridine 5-carboxymethylaminomethyl modification enzyme